MYLLVQLAVAGGFLLSLMLIHLFFFCCSCCNVIKLKAKAWNFLRMLCCCSWLAERIFTTNVACWPQLATLYMAVSCCCCYRGCYFQHKTRSECGFVGSFFYTHAHTPPAWSSRVFRVVVLSFLFSQETSLLCFNLITVWGWGSLLLLFLLFKTN